MERQRVYKALRILEKRAAVPVISACLWEATALAFPSKFTPPLTKLAHEHWWVLPAFYGVVWVHVKYYKGSTRDQTASTQLVRGRASDHTGPPGDVCV